MEKKTKYRLSGVAAGLTNGIFGGGGGIPLLVLLTSARRLTLWLLKSGN